MIGIIKLEVGRLACTWPMYNQNANDNDENDNLDGSWLVPMLRCHPEHVSLSPVTNIEAMQLAVQCIFSARSSVAVTIAQIETTSTSQCNVMVSWSHLEAARHWYGAMNVLGEVGHVED